MAANSVQLHYLLMRQLAHQLESQIRSAIRNALRQCASGAESQQQLIAQGMRELVGEMAVENEKSLSALEREGKPESAVLNSPNIVHYALLMDAGRETVNLLARAVSSTEAAKCFPNSGIWKPYSIALISFLNDQSIEPSPCKAKGYEKHILPHIHFMASSLEERQLARREIEEGFVIRNRDRRCRDWYGLDGDGVQPVNWDFRLFTLDLQLAQTKTPK